MQYTNEFINQLIEQEIIFSNQLKEKYQYPDNITHLLYVIIPAFLLKYGMNHRQLLEKCFQEVPILIEDEHDEISQAYYVSIPKWENGKVITQKGIVLKNYKDIGLMQLLDNLVHEMNHAVNSIQNEIIEKNQILIRTGIVYNYFEKKNLTFLKKGEEIILEEVMNTKQTEKIIDIIKSMSQYNITNPIVENTLYAIHHAIDSNYHSNSYILESLVCKKLMDNKTFFSTLENLRMEGQIEDIHHFFDSIVGREGALLELSKYLKKSLELQKELQNQKWFQKAKINKIGEITQQAMKIVEEFDKNTIYR